MTSKRIKELIALKEKAKVVDAKYVFVNFGVGLLGVIMVPVVVALLAATIVGIPAALLLFVATDSIILPIWKRMTTIKASIA